MSVRAIWENVATLAAIVAIILGGYALGAGFLSWLGLLLMFNLNRPV